MDENSRISEGLSFPLNSPQNRNRDGAVQQDAASSVRAEIASLA